MQYQESDNSQPLLHVTRDGTISINDGEESRGSTLNSNKATIPDYTLRNSQLSTFSREMHLYRSFYNLH